MNIRITRRDFLQTTYFNVESIEHHTERWKHGITLTYKFKPEAEYEDEEEFIDSDDIAKIEVLL